MYNSRKIISVMSFVLCVTCLMNSTFASEESNNFIDITKKWSIWPGKSAEVKVEDNTLYLTPIKDVPHISVSQVIKVKKGHLVNISGSLKTPLANDKITIAIQGFDKKWKQTNFISVYEKKNKSDKWQKFSRKLKTPAGATYLLCAIILKGEGKACLKDLNIVEISK